MEQNYWNDEEIEIQISMIKDNLHKTDKKYALFQSEIEKDETLRLIKSFIINGWPEHSKEARDCKKPYWPIKDELCIFDELVYRNMQIFLPSSPRKEILQKIHLPHLCIEKSKARGRARFYWSNNSLKSLT